MQGEIFTKLKKNFINFFRACFTVKEGGNSKYLGTIVIPNARGAWKSLFCVTAPKEMEHMSVSLPSSLLSFSHIFSHFRLCTGRRKGLKGKTYQQWIHLFMENLVV